MLNIFLIGFVVIVIKLSNGDNYSLCVKIDSTEDIACWFIDTDYNEESFFGQYAYFLGDEVMKVFAVGQ